MLSDGYGHTFTRATPDPPAEIGAATGIELLDRDRFLAAAEPARRGGGSAMVVDGRSPADVYTSGAPGGR